MLRNLEVLVNSICDDKIKEYMEEALRCYYGQSYRGCVILSVIAGMHDLRLKIKNLASSINEFKDLDDELEKKIANKEVIERYLIEQCATSKIDFLSSSEKNELERILDIRNECAHPNEYNCTAEIALAVFTKIIDMLLSKPQLVGMQHISILINQLIREENFFPIDNNDKIKNIVEEKLKILNRRAYIPLAKKLVDIIKNESVNMKLKKNSINFLANMNEVIDNKSLLKIIESLIIDEKYIDELFRLLERNLDLLEIIDETDYSKMLVNINKRLNNNQGIYKEDIVFNILNNESSKMHSEQITNILTNSINNNKLFLINRLFKENYLYIDKELLIEKLKKEITMDLNLKIYQLENFNEIVMLVGDDELFKSIGLNIGFRIRDNDFYTANNGCDALMALSQEVTDKIFEFNRIKIVSGIINAENMNANRAKNIVRDIDNCIFMKSFIKNNLTKEELEEFINESKTSSYGMERVLSYIQKNNKEMMNDIIEKLQKLDKENINKYRLVEFCEVLKKYIEKDVDIDLKNEHIKNIDTIIYEIHEM